jgi:cell wall-associated NlpC family hydrolase
VPASVHPFHRVLRPATLALLALCLALAAVLVPPSGAEAAGRSPKRAATVALHQIGDPYRYGARGPGSFDCSGLVQYSYQKAGFRNVPRTSSQQARAAHRIPRSHLRRGDLMFFHDGGGVYHVGMFLRWTHGRALMVHAPSPGKRVQRAHPWTNSWFAGTFRH